MAIERKVNGNRLIEKSNSDLYTRFYICQILHFRILDISVGILQITYLKKILVSISPLAPSPLFFAVKNIFNKKIFPLKSNRGVGFASAPIVGF
jgi:hypothetical protein